MVPFIVVVAGRGKIAEQTKVKRNSIVRGPLTSEHDPKPSRMPGEIAREGPTDDCLMGPI
jgi:hypothetical protein